MRTCLTEAGSASLPRPLVVLRASAAAAGVGLRFGLAALVTLVFHPGVEFGG